MRYFAKVTMAYMQLVRSTVCFHGFVEELCEEVESVRGFCYLEDRVNATGGCEAAVGSE